MANGSVGEVKNGENMGYVLRVRLASFFAGAAVASFSGIYLLQRDHKVFHYSLSRQVPILIPMSLANLSN